MTVSPFLPILQAPPPALPDDFATFDPARFRRVLAEGVPADDMARAAALVARMGQLRVGGAFWREADAPAWDKLLPILPGGSASPEHEAAAALISATDYRDPFTGAPSTAEAFVEQLGEWRRAIDRNREVACCVGMAWWKRARMAALFRAGDDVPAFRRSATGAVRAAVARGGAIAVWGTRIPPGLADLAAAAGVPVLLVEDGFVRSRGLGSGMLPPSSIVVDGRGIYFDPSRPSDLEHLLAATDFDAPTLARARRLMDVLVERDVTKYAAGHTEIDLPPREGRTRILVPGQVADDLSVRLGGGAIQDNFTLLSRVREANPAAQIVYRPHPDVDAGHRRGAIPDRLALTRADTVQRGGSMAALVSGVDEVHTLTSLAGFEALLRRKRVVTYGWPFYAGWGLTTDNHPVDDGVLRRNKILPIEGLVAGTLLAYSRYLDPVTDLPCGPEVLIERFSDRGVWRPSVLMRGRRIQGWVRSRLVRWVQARAPDGRR